jgi:hypothetical protein
MLLKILKFVSWFSLILSNNVPEIRCKDQCHINIINTEFFNTIVSVNYPIVKNCLSPFRITPTDLGLIDFSSIDLQFENAKGTICCRDEIEKSFYFCSKNNPEDIVFQFIDGNTVDSSRKITFNPVNVSRFGLFFEQIIQSCCVDKFIMDMNVVFRSFVQRQPIELYIKNTGVRPLDRLFVGIEQKDTNRYLMSSAKSSFIFPTEYLDDGSWLVKLDVSTVNPFTNIVCWVNDGDIAVKTILELNMQMTKIELQIPELVTHPYKDNTCVKSDLIIPVTFPVKNIKSSRTDYDVIIVGSGFLANIIANSFTEDNDILVIDPGNGFEDVNVSSYINIKDSGVSGFDRWYAQGRSLLSSVARELGEYEKNIFPLEDLQYLNTVGYEKARKVLNAPVISSEQQTMADTIHGTVTPRLEYKKISFGKNVHRITYRLVNRILDKNSIQVADMSNDAALTTYKSPIIYLASGTIGNIRVLSSNQKLFNESKYLGVGITYLRETKYEPYVLSKCDDCVNVTIDKSWLDFSGRFDIDHIDNNFILRASFYTSSKYGGNIWHSPPLHKPSISLKQTDDEHNKDLFEIYYQQICQELSGSECTGSNSIHLYTPLASELTGGSNANVQTPDYKKYINVVGRSSLAIPLWDRTLVTVALALKSPTSSYKYSKSSYSEKKKIIDYVDHACIPSNMISANLSNVSIEYGQAYASKKVVPPFLAIGVGARSDTDDSQEYNGTGVRLIMQESGVYHWSHYDLPVPNLINFDDIYDTYASHATQTAGVLFSKRNNFGTTGIAYGSTPYYLKPGALITSMSFFRYGDVLTNSFGITQSASWELEQDLAPYIKELVKRGVRIFSSAGNGGCNMDSDKKSCTDIFLDKCVKYSREMDTGTFIVASMEPMDTSLRPNSNCGKRVDLVSWGYNVTTTINTRDGYIYNYMDTSSATPISAAAGALIQQFLNQKNIIVSSLAFRSVIVTTGSTFTKNIYPQINVDNAVVKFQEYLGLELPTAKQTICQYNMRVLTINVNEDLDFLITALYNGEDHVNNTLSEWSEFKCFETSSNIDEECRPIPCGNRFIYQTKENVRFVVKKSNMVIYSPDTDNGKCPNDNSKWCSKSTIY